MENQLREVTCVKSTENKYGGVFSKGRTYKGIYNESGKRMKVEDDNHRYHYISWLRAENERWAKEHFVGM